MSVGLGLGRARRSLPVVRILPALTVPALGAFVLAVALLLAAVVQAQITDRDSAQDFTTLSAAGNNNP